MRPSSTTRKNQFIILGLLVALAVVPPWIAAYLSDKAVRYHYGLMNGRAIECLAVDGTHFDRYFCLVFDDSTSSRVTENNGHISMDGRPVKFPAGKNVGFLRSDGQMQFYAVAQSDIAPDSFGNSEIYYLLGRVPKFKRLPFGVPRVEFVEQRFPGLN
jgi:hypothetical protein